MITIFSSPKPFVDPLTVMIQRNAIGSWAALEPKCNVILFGREPGIAEIAEEFNLRHEPEAEYKNGKPLIQGLFKKAEGLYNNNLLAYVNADIVLPQEFITAVNKARQKFDSKPFLMVGQRCNLEIKEPIDFKRHNWQEELNEKMKLFGKMSGPFSIDYFVFTKGLWQKIPPFTIGRAAFDNWLIYQAKKLHANVIDATLAVKVTHQHHLPFITNESTPKVLDKNAFEDFLWHRAKSPEALFQVNLVSTYARMFGTRDANWVFQDTFHLKKKTALQMTGKNIRRHLAYLKLRLVSTVQSSRNRQI
jgi:hypothetical protein